MEPLMRGMWEHFNVKRAWAIAVLADAEREKQEGMHDKLEQVKT